MLPSVYASNIYVGDEGTNSIRVYVSYSIVSDDWSLRASRLVLASWQGSNNKTKKYTLSIYVMYLLFNNTHTNS